MHSSMEQKLRQQAQQMLPSFSADLHSHTLNAVQHAPAALPLGSHSLPWGRLGLAMAATIALAIGIWHLLPDATVPTPLGPQPQQLANTLDISVPASADLLQTLYLVGPTPLQHLKTDAQSLAHYLIRQLPQSMPGDSKI